MKKNLYLPRAENDVIWVAAGDLWVWLFFWLLLINIVTFFAFGIDKRKAKRKEKKESVRRIPEKTLFLLSALGGSVGALIGMRVWHHKTRHRSFRIGIPVILAAQLLLPLGLWIYGTFGG